MMCSLDMFSEADIPHSCCNATEIASPILVGSIHTKGTKSWLLLAFLPLTMQRLSFVWYVDGT